MYPSVARVPGKRVGRTCRRTAVYGRAFEMLAQRPGNQLLSNAAHRQDREGVRTPTRGSRITPQNFEVGCCCRRGVRGTYHESTGHARAVGGDKDASMRSDILCSMYALMMRAVLVMPVVEGMLALNSELVKPIRLPRMRLTKKTFPPSSLLESQYKTRDAKCSTHRMR